MFEAAPYGVVIADEDGTILFANDMVNTTFRFAAGELVGQPISRLVPAASRAVHGDHWKEFWEDPRGRGMGLDRYLTGTRKDGAIVPLEIALNILEEGASRYVVASIVDLTDRRDLEARLAAATTDFVNFHPLVAEIAARFGGVEAGRLNETIVESLQQIGEALRLDRAILWRRHSGESIPVATHVWGREPQTPPDPRLLTSTLYVIAKLKAVEACSFTRADDLPDPIDREIFRLQGIHSGAVIPLVFNGQEADEIGAIAFSSMTRDREWTPEIMERLRLVAGVISQAIVRTRSHVALQNALDEIKSLRDRLSAESVELRREVRVLRTSGVVVSDSPPMKRVLAQIEQVAPTPATVLLLGETGHRQRGDGPGDSRSQPAPRAADGAGELRGYSAPRSSRASCSAASGARTPARSRVRSAASKRPTSRRCSSTKSASCRWRSRSSCSACCRSGSSSGWGARSRSRWTSASSPPPTATSRRRSKTRRFAKTCSTA